MRNARKGMPVALCSAILLLVTLSIPLMVSTNARADQLWPLTVDGKVTDSQGRPMEGVPVVVSSKNGETIVKTNTTYTDANGFYTVGFGPSDWDIGYTILAVATWGGNQVDDSLTASGEPVETINLAFEFEIPEFGTVLGFIAVAALVGVVALFLLPKRSKDANQ